jgi:hypothetical protein
MSKYDLFAELCFAQGLLKRSFCCLTDSNVPFAVGGGEALPGVILFLASGNRGAILLLTSIVMGLDGVLSRVWDVAQRCEM